MSQRQAVSPAAERGDSQAAPRPSRRRWLGPLIALAAVAGLGVWAVRGWVLPNVSPRNFGIVEPGKLYRAGALSPGATERVHREFGIRTVVDLGGYDKDPVGDRIAQRTAEALGMERYVFPLEGDGTGNPNAYVAALRVITDPAKQPVLVHCSAGAQRTSGCVMLYKECVHGQPLEETYPEARAFWHDPARNPRLLPFVREHERAIVEAVRGGTQIDAFPKLDLAPRRSR